MKRCTKCKTEKNDNEFYRNKVAKNRLSSWCKECYKEKNAKWYQINSEKSIKYARDWGKNNPERFKRNAFKSHLKRLYGMTIEEYNNLLKLQNNVCAICKEPETRIRNGNITSLMVDHDHKTGKVRELLCSGCNSSLPIVEDTEKLKKFQIYLEKWSR